MQKFKNFILSIRIILQNIEIYGSICILSDFDIEFQSFCIPYTL